MQPILALSMCDVCCFACSCAAYFARLLLRCAVCITVCRRYSGVRGVFVVHSSFLNVRKGLLKPRPLIDILLQRGWWCYFLRLSVAHFC